MRLPVRSMRRGSLSMMRSGRWATSPGAPTLFVLFPHPLLSFNADPVSGGRQLYFKASGLHIWALSVVLMLVSNNTSIIERYFVSLWTSNYPGGKAPPKEQFTASSFSHHHHDALYSVNGHIAHQSVFMSSFAPQNGTFESESLPPADTHPMTYILIYTAILFGSGVITILQALIGYIGAYRASVRIHNDMLHTVVRSTSRWVSLSLVRRGAHQTDGATSHLLSSSTQPL